jgi:hypothetical protein
MQDLAKGRALRDAQLALFSARDAAFLQRCRALAVVVAKQEGEVSINDIRGMLEPPAGVSPNVYGAVFKDSRFQAVGYTQAVHPEAHARAVRTYKLKEGEPHGQ